MLSDTRKVTFRLLPLVALFAVLTLGARVNDYWLTWDPISVAQAQEKSEEKEGSDKPLQSDDLGDATLQEALDEDAKSSAICHKPSTCIEKPK